MIFTSERRNLENPATPLTLETLADYIEGATGGSVSEDQALRLAAVYSCIFILSSSLAQLPLAVMRRTGSLIEKATDHAAYGLLHDEPNPWQSSYDWRERSQADAVGWGNGLTRIIRSRRGDPLQLERCKPHISTLVKTGSGRYVYQVQDDDDGLLAIQPEDMIHIRAIGYDGRWGRSPIRQHAETIGLGLAAQRYGSAFFEGGGRPTGILTPKSPLSTQGWDSLKKVWAQVVQRLRQDSNKTVLLPADLEYKAMTISPEEAQFLETRKMTRSEIAGIFNVPAHMINDLEKATFSNISEQAIQFVRHTMMPWCVKWEQEINRKLFTAAERRAGYYCKFNVAALLRGTPKERGELYHFAITDGWMDRNEVRVMEDMNPRDGLDEMLVSVNAVPLSQFGRQQQEPK